jgi:hypothetical protein
MTQLGGRQWAQMWTALSSVLASAVPAEARTERHLAVDAVVAYVDGELSLPAHERATRHLAGCTLCTAEVAAQRQVRAAVRSATSPAMPPSLLAALYAIPHSVDLPPGPEKLAVGEDGQLVAAQRPTGDSTRQPTDDPAQRRLGDSAPFGATPPLGSGHRLGSTGMGTRGRMTRRVVQGTGMVVSGLVLGALALSSPDESTAPGSPRPGAERGGIPVSGVPARFEFGPRSNGNEGADGNEPDEPLTVTGLPQR